MGAPTTHPAGAPTSRRAQGSSMAMRRDSVRADGRDPGVTEYAAVGAIGGVQVAWLAALAWLVVHVAL
jgi:hypothetical protein